MKVPDLFVGKRLQVGNGIPKIFGVGPLEVRGSSYTEGPAMVGNSNVFDSPIPTELGTVMCGPTSNVEMKPIPFYSLFVVAFARIKSFLKVDQLLSVRLIKSQLIYTEVLMANTKNFIIDHPTDNTKHLVYACLEGPENGVYCRGKLRNNDTIYLPEVWRKLVNVSSITVSLTPVGSHQNLIVKGITDNTIKIQSNTNTPINCHYHVFGERIDTPRLVTEVDK